MPTAGRPSKYDPEFCEIAHKLISSGSTNTEVAQALGVANSTLQLWLLEYPSFSESVKLARQSFDERVEKKLAERALGYSHPDTVFHVIDNEVVATETVKYYPPDTAAAFIWLKNRRPREWKDQPIEVNHNVSLPKALEEAFERVYGSKALGEPTTDAEIMQETEAGWGEIWGIREDAERRPQGIE